MNTNELIQAFLNQHVKQSEVENVYKPKEQ